jgi:P27 family predicted phage terminase small subunit
MARPVKPVAAVSGNITKAERERREKAEARLNVGAGKVRCPAWLDPAARRVWRALVAELKKLELVTNLDVAALAVLADAIARHREAAALVAEQGPVITPEGGRPMQNPAVLIVAKYAGIIRQYGAAFGLDPGGRAKLAATLPEPEPEPTQFEMMFGNVLGKKATQ